MSEHTAEKSDTNTKSLQTFATSELLKRGFEYLSKNIFDLNLLMELKEREKHGQISTSDKANTLNLFEMIINCCYKDAEMGNIEARRALGDCYAYGIGIRENSFQAIQYYQEAAEKGDAISHYRLGCAYQKSFGVNKDPKKAVYHYKMAAERGHVESEYLLGEAYQHGWGVDKDVKEAVLWYRVAAEKGDAIAQNKLGDCYQLGLGVDKDLKQSVRWHRLAAEQGDVNAQMTMANIYRQGIGVEEDSKEVVRYYSMATDQGHARAKYSLGACYLCGFGVEQNIDEALLYFRWAAMSGEVRAQALLASYYESGTYVDKDMKKSMEYHAMAAQQGNVSSQFSLAQGYEKGVGVEQDQKMATYYYRQAANGGEIEAINRVGYCYEFGIGIDKNIEKALHYYRKAVRRGNQSAKRRLNTYYQYGTSEVKDKIKAYQKHDVFLKQEFNNMLATSEIKEKSTQELMRYCFLAADADTTGENFVKLGRYYERGVGVDQKPNWAKAAELYLKGAVKGNEMAKDLLSMLPKTAITLDEEKEMIVEIAIELCSKYYASNRIEAPNVLKELTRLKTCIRPALQQELINDIIFIQNKMQEMRATTLQNLSEAIVLPTSLFDLIMQYVSYNKEKKTTGKRLIEFGEHLISRTFWGASRTHSSPKDKEDLNRTFELK